LTAEEGEFYPMQSRYAADAVNRTLHSWLGALKLTGMAARDPLEASSFAGVWRVWKKLRSFACSTISSRMAVFNRARVTQLLQLVEKIEFDFCHCESVIHVQIRAKSLIFLRVFV